jgi:hypothetical protein
MAEKAKENEVSRRDFIRDLGGGAIGAAMISTQLLDPRPVGAAAAKSKITLKAGMTAKQLGDTWGDIRKVTTDILKEFEGLGVKQVNLRLNLSGTKDKIPMWFDWLAVKDVTDKLANRSGVMDYGAYRFGDRTPSAVYNEGLEKAGKAIVERDWGCDQLLKEKRVESRLLVQKAGLMYQRFAALISELEGSRRAVGLLSVGLEKKPSKLEDVDAKMKEWASWSGYPKSKLVDFIEKNFILGGPPA